MFHRRKCCQSEFDEHVLARARQRACRAARPKAYADPMQLLQLVTKNRRQGRDGALHAKRARRTKAWRHHVLD